MSKVINNSRLEKKFKNDFLSDIQEQYPDCMIMPMNHVQGIPDTLILYKNKWAALEFKKFSRAKRQPNQPYYVQLMDDMSFSRFVYPENRQEVMNDIQKSFRTARSARISRSKQIPLDKV